MKDDQSRSSKEDRSCKCDEVHKLPPITSQPPNIACIIDRMAILQSLNKALFKTFGDLVEEVLKKILCLLHDDNMRPGCVTVVFDRYDKTDSIKSMERERRGAGENIPKSPAPMMYPSVNCF